MGVFLFIAALSAATGIADPPWCARESRETCDLVLAATTPVLPQPLPAWMEQHSDAIRSACLALPLQSGNDQRAPVTTSSHFIKLDMAAQTEDAPERLKAARAFPRERKAARALFEAHHEKIGGDLPWTLNEQFQQLQSAFQSQETRTAADICGVILHLATDAALPFNVTFDLEGLEAAQSPWCDPNTMSLTSICSLRHRTQRVLLERLHSRLHYELRVSPDRFRPVDEALPTTFRVLVDSYEALNRMREADRWIADELHVRDAAHFQSASDAYYAHLADRCGPVLEERLEAAALLSANLIGSAWIRAGRPNLTILRESAAPSQTTSVDEIKPSSAQPPEAPSAARAYAASVNSTVFHRAGCAHLLRIKPENLVQFTTIEEARAGGRTPCKSCKP